MLFVPLLVASLSEPIILEDRPRRNDQQQRAKQNAYTTKDLATKIADAFTILGNQQTSDGCADELGEGAGCPHNTNTHAEVGWLGESRCNCIGDGDNDAGHEAARRQKSANSHEH